MPRKSSKYKFHGTPSWSKQHEEDGSAAASSENAASSLEVTCEIDLAKSHPSVKRNKRISSLHDQECDVSDEDVTCAERSTGYRFIDLECLQKELSNVQVHMCNNAGLSIQDENDDKGLCGLLSLACLSCGEKTFFRTSEPIPEKLGVRYDVNRRAAYACSEIGIGREAFADFTGVMGMPPPSQKKSWYDHMKSINTVVECEFEKEIKEAGERLRAELKDAESKTEDEEQDSVFDIAVSFDGSWHHRGFTSSHGVGVVMSVDTGDVLDAVALSKDCSVCLNNLDKDDEWKNAHADSGLCEKNFDGPSSSMETKAATILWSRSIEKHGLRYTTLLADGDNKTLKALNEELKPYGDTNIGKSECVNHVHKRMGTGLRELKKKNPHISGGTGNLSEPKITVLSDYYKTAIMSNTTSSKNVEVQKEHLKSMQKDCLAGLYHNIGNKSACAMHTFCPDRWCKYQQEKKYGTTTYDHNKAIKKALPSSYLKHMLCSLYTQGSLMKTF